MLIFFRVLSAIYIAGIFVLADSPMVEDVATFNPYSLLHIPLYGVLTFLLVLSFFPKGKRLVRASGTTDSIDPTNPMDSINSTNSTNPSNPSNPRNYLFAGIIAGVVAVADEVHQAYLPARNASIVDVLLDMIGIMLALLIFQRFEQRLIGFLNRNI